jgi:hypothetical protein
MVARVEKCIPDPTPYGSFSGFCTSRSETDLFDILILQFSTTIQPHESTMTTPRLLLISLSIVLLIYWGTGVPVVVEDDDADKVIPDWQSILTDSDRISVIHLFGPIGTSWSLHSSADDSTHKHEKYEIKSSAVVVPGDILVS